MGVEEMLRQIGRDEGLAIGLKKGLATGREIGRKVGRKEVRKEILEWKKGIVGRLLAEEKFTVADIGRLVDVSEYFIRKVKKELKGSC